MAQYSTDFSEYTLTSTPGDWTSRWTAGTSFTVESGNDVSGDRHLLIEAATGSAWSWDDIDADANRDVVDILMAVKLASVATSTNPRIGALMLGNADRDGYFGGISDSTNARVRRVSNNTEVTVTSNTTHGPYTTATLWWMRIQRDGTSGGTVRTKLWTGHPVDDQPASWGTTSNDTTITAAGWVGIYATSTASDPQVHYFAVGTNGDAAPSPGAGDSTAPVLSSPTGSATGSTTATIGATTDEANGTLFAVLSLTNSEPTGTQVEAGQNAAGATATWNSGSGQAITTAGAKTFNVTGLAAGTTYYPYLMHKDAAGNRSTVLAAPSFTTSAAADPPVITSHPSNATVKNGQTAQFDCAATGSGTLTYQWQVDTGGGFANVSNGATYSGATTDTLDVVSTNAMDGYLYRCNVSDDDAGPTATNSATLTVNEATLALNAAGYEIGDGNSPATMAVDASVAWEVEVISDALPPSSVYHSDSVTTSSLGRLADISDPDFVYGTTYAVLCRRISDGEWVAFTVAAT